MSAGRGSVRVNPVSGAPAPWVIPADQSDYHIYQVPPGPWGVVQKTAADGQMLTPEYAPYGGNNGNLYRIPYGAVRLSLIVNYVPAVVGGQLGLQIKWDPVSSYGLGTFLYPLDIFNTATFGSGTTDPQLAELAQYGQGIVTPTLLNLTEQNYVLSFWVPPMIPEVNPAATDLQPTIPLRLAVREVSVGSPGTFSLLAIVSESFGQPFLVRGTTP